MKIKGEAARLWAFLAIIVVALGAVLLLFAGDPRVAVRAVTLAEPPTTLTPPATKSVSLPYNLDVMSYDSDRAETISTAATRRRRSFCRTWW